MIQILPRVAQLGQPLVELQLAVLEMDATFE